MNLISCGCCGTVLDKDRISEPEDLWMDDIRGGGRTINPRISAWVGDNLEFTINCPACKNRIFYSNGDEVY